MPARCPDPGRPAGEPLGLLPAAQLRPLGRPLLPPARHSRVGEHRPAASPRSCDQTELIYPDPKPCTSEPCRDGREPWAVRHDWQLRRNRAAYPRAWVVHTARVRSPARGPGGSGRLMRALVFMNDPIWSEPDRPVFDLRQTALIETDDREGLKGVLSRGAGRAIGVGGGRQARAAAGGAEGRAEAARAWSSWPTPIIPAGT